jgi:hypothetical protein
MSVISIGQNVLHKEDDIYKLTMIFLPNRSVQLSDKFLKAGSLLDDLRSTTIQNTSFRFGEKGKEYDSLSTLSLNHTDDILELSFEIQVDRRFFYQ